MGFVIHSHESAMSVREDTNFVAQIIIEYIFLYPSTLLIQFFQEVRCCFQSLSLKNGDSSLFTNSAFFSERFSQCHSWSLVLFLKDPSSTLSWSNSLTHIYHFNNPSYLYIFFISLDLFRFVSHVIDVAYSLYQLYSLQLQMKVSMLLQLPSWS